MRFVGQLCLLATFVGTGYTAFASVVGWSVGSRRLLQSSIWAGALSFLATTVSTFVLCRALITKDFHFEYVAQYVSQHLGWQYSLSALWVGQAGSLLLWTWFSLALAIVLRCQTLRTRWPLSEPAYGMLMGFCFFLAMVMIFAADPMARNLAPTLDGAGLSPVLQHPVMLIHPPVVFFGYASSAVPAAIAFTALAAGKLDATWTELARPWSLLSWGILGAGILLGARWAYTELGWGGYWGWDPVENGSLVPWLLATATLHSHMTWRRGGQQKKLAVALPIATFAMCNFSTFLTRSGIFSSLHAFSQSPIGWLFLVWMIGIASAAGVLIIVRRESLRRHPSPAILWSRESMILANTVAFIALAVAICLGTMAPTLTDAIVGRKVVIGPQFYNQMLIPTGLLIMLTTGLAPLLRWGAPPNAAQRKMLTHVACTAVASACIAYFGSGRQVLWSVVCGLFTLGVGSIVANWCVDAIYMAHNPWQALRLLVGRQRRQTGGFVAHVGFFCLALGITASALGTSRVDQNLKMGESIPWGDSTLSLREMNQYETPDKLIAEARLVLSGHSQRERIMRPSQHYHKHRREWTTEVDVLSTIQEDYYAVLHGGEVNDQVRLTLVHSPLVSLIWLGGLIMGIGGIIAGWPSRQVRRSGARGSSDQLAAETPVPTIRRKAA